MEHKNIFEDLKEYMFTNENMERFNKKDILHKEPLTKPSFEKKQKDIADSEEQVKKLTKDIELIQKHIDVFCKKEKAQFHGRIFCMVSSNQFIFCLR